jgi:hypothetical protein
MRVSDGYRIFCQPGGKEHRVAWWQFEEKVEWEGFMMEKDLSMF